MGQGKEDKGDRNLHEPQDIRRNYMQYQAGYDAKARAQSGAHPSDITNDLSPEERTHIKKRGLSTTNLDLDGRYKEAKNTITNNLGPEERTHIRERSLRATNLNLDEMYKEAKNTVTTVGG